MSDEAEELVENVHSLTGRHFAERESLGEKSQRQNLSRNFCRVFSNFDDPDVTVIKRSFLRHRR